MSLQVDWTRPALDDVDRLDRRTKERIFHAIDRYATTGHGDARKMSGREDEFRLRVASGASSFAFWKANSLSVSEEFCRGVVPIRNDIPWMNLSKIYNLCCLNLSSDKRSSFQVRYIT